MARRRLLISLVATVTVAFGLLITNLALGNKPLLGLDLQGGASITYRPLSGNYDSDALAEVDDLYRERIEGLNVGEAEVVRQGDTIVVNLPGVKDQEQAIELIGTTGKVTFRPVLNRLGGFEGLTVPPTAGATDPGPLVTIVPTTAPIVPPEAAPAATSAATAPAPASTTPATTAPGGPSRVPSQSGTTTPPAPTTPATTGPAPTAPVTTVASATTVGAAAAGATTVPATTVPGPTTTAAPFDPNSIITPADQDLPDQEVTLPDRDGTVLYEMGPVFATGEEAVESASAEVSLDGLGWQVSLTLTDAGLDAWNQAANECFNRAPTCSDGGMAIIIDHRVISAPVPQDPFFDQKEIRITNQGGFKESDARQLARVLKYGATPVEMVVQASQTVSATIGEDSLRAAIVAGIIGVLLVLAFMLFYYRRLAIVVAAGLCVSGALIWSMVTIFDEFFVLTLAGVTGIIVSIGVTVDSYVVFFERLKDDVKGGRTLRNSAQRGFASAWRTILAADIVSLLGAVVLWYLSVGSVRGFALFLGLSTVVDMVVAYFFTRPAVILLSRRPSFQGAVLGVQAPTNEPVPASTGGAA